MTLANAATFAQGGARSASPPPGASHDPTVRDRQETVPVTDLRALAEWSHEDGPVLWWKFPIDEPPYVGTPDDVGRAVGVLITGTRENDGYAAGRSYQVGGWPGYHTHWTKIALPDEPSP